MTPRTKDLVAVTPGGDITADMIAGEYLFYSISDDLVPIVRVRRAMKNAGLDDSRLPKERRPEHVVQEACRRCEEVTTNGHRIEIRAERVLYEGKELVYQITRHVQDKNQRVIDHPKALRVTYNAATADLRFEPLDKTPAAEVADLEEKIRDHFEKNSTKMPGHKLRTILRHYIEDVGAENMRGNSGGVYFMPKKNRLRGSLAEHHGPTIDGQEFITAVAAMLGEVYGNPDAIHRIPCVNDKGQRAFLKRRFVENVEQDLKEYRDELLDLVSSTDRKRAFRKDKVDNLIERREAIDERRATFAEILGETLGELDRDMKLADQALRKFLAAPAPKAAA